MITCNLEDGENTESLPNAILNCGQSYTYSCLPGYESNDTRTVVCTSEGSLSQSAPNCTSKFWTYVWQVL